MEEKQPEKQPKKKRRVLRWLIFTLVGIFIFAAFTVGGYAYYLYEKGEKAVAESYDAGRDVKSSLREEEVEPLEDNLSILIVGIDDSTERAQGSNHARSDALMLATLNNADKTIDLVSIPRDSYTFIPSVNYATKINHAHAFGGIDSTIETVQNLLNVPVDYYVEVNFNAFIDVVNALDGIEVDVPYDLHELDENDKRTVNLKKGTQVVDGREALALARTRHQDSDIERGKRQQMILEAITDKAMSTSSLTKYSSLITALGDNMTTNMSFDTMKSLFVYMQSGSPSIKSLSLEGDDDMSTGVYYYKLRQDNVLSVRQTLQKQLALPEDKEITLENSYLVDHVTKKDSASSNK
ncbi:transcriptional regulator [Kurthia sp. 3B1D]|uniref:Transcriptional regulator n=2 Tax=Kurthia TaxID=1649 RepID=A0A433RVE6_9BACL|nr:LCP family protein [Kurthia sp. 3B1D]RUS57262.1 transcriptional regulator [Kurthia sp. 3B1D]